MATTIKMPQLGESVTEGTIERWLVKEGDTVEQYDPLFEVVTDKVNAEVPAEIAGTIAKILVPDGETVAVGTPVAEIDSDGAGAGAEPAAVAETSAEAPAAPAEPSPAATEGEAAPQEASAPAQVETPVQADATPPADAPTSGTEPASADEEAGGSNGDSSARMTPAVRRLVREHEIDVAKLKGTGAGGRVTRDDVLQFIDGGGAAQTAAEASPTPEPTPAPAAEPAAATAPSPAPASPPMPTASGGDTEVALSQMRKAIARKMTQVKQTVPHAYTVIEVDMTSAVRWREANNAAFKAREGASISFVAVVVKAVTEALRKHPTLNSQFADDRIILKQAMNIGIAVAVDNGLIVPVIANADQLSISGVNARIRDISGRAKAGKLRLDELQGGTFTVNNTGWFGSVSSMPIINAPEVAILSMEAIVKRPRVMEVDGEDVIAIRHMMNMTCSFDHRVLDGAQVG
ncbi:MAG: dihydrolipoamide acetyltransferase family protein, partial [Candidatus Limnocylindria bacterium]